MVDNESVEKICSQIREDGEKEIESILGKAEQTASDIKAKAEERGRKIADKVIKEAEEKGETAQRRLLSSVNLEVRRTKLKAREEVVSNAYEKVREVLNRLKGGKSYPEILANLIAESVIALEGNSFVVYVDSKDLGLLESRVFPAVKKLVEKEGRRVEGFEARSLKEPSLGGARVGVPGGNVVFDNTFEARIYRLRDSIRNIIFEEVFSPEGSEESGSA